jgi:hypothetical protein
MHAETESTYPVKESTLRLNATQRFAATALLAERPLTIPGTRVILNREQQLIWFAKVTASIEELNLPKGLVGAFCDVAGVPD